MWTPWTDYDRNFQAMDDFRRRMDRIFEEMETSPSGTVFAQFPRTNLYDTDAAYVLIAEVPGLGEKDIELTVHQDVLTLTGERMDDTPEGFSVHRKERVPLKFSRSFTLPGNVDADHVTASVQDGLLTVTLPKTEASRPRQIAVEMH